MFICEECIEKTDKLKSVLRSRGLCEVCGKVKVCYDVNIHGDKK